MVIKNVYLLLIYALLLFSQPVSSEVSSIKDDENRMTIIFLCLSFVGDKRYESRIYQIDKDSVHKAYDKFITHLKQRYSKDDYSKLVSTTMVNAVYAYKDEKSKLHKKPSEFMEHCRGI